MTEPREDHKGEGLRATVFQSRVSTDSAVHMLMIYPVATLPGRDDIGENRRDILHFTCGYPSLTGIQGTQAGRVFLFSLALSVEE